jgi:hypothetical protein
MVLARVTIEILGPVPMAPLHTEARLVRPGRSVELLEAVLEQDHRPVMRASGWRVRVSDERPPTHASEQAPPLPGPEAVSPPDPAWRCGFLLATEWRFVRGSYATPGAALAWTRLRYPLVAGSITSPMQRLLAAVDSANGISSALDIRSWLFIPPELTVHSLRPPEGEWICLDATTHVQAEGVGLTTAAVYDQRGFVGRSAQALLLSHR